MSWAINETYSSQVGVIRDRQRIIEYGKWMNRMRFNSPETSAMAGEIMAMPGCPFGTKAAFLRVAGTYPGFVRVIKSRVEYPHYYFDTTILDNYPTMGIQAEGKYPKVVTEVIDFLKDDNNPEPESLEALRDEPELVPAFARKVMQIVPRGTREQADAMGIKDSEVIKKFAEFLDFAMAVKFEREMR